MILCSVIIPTYNRANKLEVLLYSLVRQTISPEEFEIIIVDDCSTDATQEVVLAFSKKFWEYQVRYIKQDRNLGQTRARNSGIKKSVGEIIFFTDDDCEVPALWIDTMLNIYKEVPHIHGVGGWYTPLLSSVKNNIYAQAIYMTTLFQYSERCLFTEGSSKEFLPRYRFPGFNTANLSVKAWVAKKIMFDDRFGRNGCEDLDFVMRAISAGFEFYYIPYFITHHKENSLFSFLRGCLIRLRGIYLYREFRKGRREKYGGAFATYPLVQFLNFVNFCKYITTMYKTKHITTRAVLLGAMFQFFANSKVLIYVLSLDLRKFTKNSLRDF